MLLELDVEKLDSMMESVLQLREERGYMPNRDEDKIAEILQKWEASSAEQHRLLIESQRQFTDKPKYQRAANQSDTLKIVNTV